MLTDKEINALILESDERDREHDKKIEKINNRVKEICVPLAELFAMHKLYTPERIAKNIAGQGATAITDKDVQELKKGLKNIIDDKSVSTVDVETFKNKISELEVAMASVRTDADVVAAALHAHNADLEDMVYRAQKRIDALDAEADQHTDQLSREKELTESQIVIIDELSIAAHNQKQKFDIDEVYYTTQIDLAQASYEELKGETDNLQARYDELINTYLTQEEKLKRAGVSAEREQRLAKLAESAIEELALYKSREAERQHAHDIAQTAYGTCVVTAAILNTDPTPQKNAIVTAFQSSSIDAVYDACTTCLTNAKTALRTAARESLTPAMTASFALFMATSLIATIAAARGDHAQPALTFNRAPFVDACSARHAEARTQRDAAAWAAVCAVR